MSRMEERGVWRSLCRAVAESCAPTRNWRWMLASLGIGAGFGMIAGLHRLGQQAARVTPEVAATVVQVAMFFFVMAWGVSVAVRFGRLLLSSR